MEDLIFLLFMQNSINTDNRNDVYERSGENNNTRFIQILLRVPAPADLIVTNVTFSPDSAIPGDEVTVSWSLQNIGENRAVGRLIDAVYVSSDTIWQVEDALIAVMSHEIHLDPGSQEILRKKVYLSDVYKADEKGNITGTLPGLIPGSYHIIVRSDIRNNIREKDITNNFSFAHDAITTNIPELTFGEFITGSISKKEKIYYRIEIEARTDFMLELNCQGDESAIGLYVAYDRIPMLSDFDLSDIEFSKADKQIAVPVIQLGTYYILIASQNGDLEVNYRMRADVLHFSILEISPNHGGSGGRVTTKIKGSGFRETTLFFLETAPNLRMQPQKIEYINSTEVNVRWNLESVQIGQYDVIAESIDETTFILNQGFKVEESKGLNVVYSRKIPPYTRLGSINTYSFSFTNPSNIDLPYLKMQIFLPNIVQFINSNSDGFFSFDQFKNREICTDCLDYQILEDSENCYSLIFIDKIAVNVPPGRSIKYDFSIKAIEAGELPIIVYYDILTERMFMEYIFSSLESVRTKIINDDHSVPDSLLYYAQNREEFVKYIHKSFVDVGLFDSTSFVDSDNYSDNYEMSNDNRMQKLKKIGASTICDQSNYQMNGFDKRYWCETILKYICGSGFLKLSVKCVLWCKNFWLPAPAVACIIVCEVAAFWGNRFVCGRPPEVICSWIFGPSDPNEINGPPGFGDANWIGRNDNLMYIINFENDSSLATAPAQNTRITQKTDIDLNLRDCRLSHFGFGSYLFEIPENSAFYTKRLDLSDSLGVLVDVTAGIDITRNEIFWVFESIDPITGEVPLWDGFLPVNDALGRGQGFVSYTIRAKDGTKTRDIINAQANIVFDVNEPVDTPMIFNTIDADPPRSHVRQCTPLAGESILYRVNWAGSDSTGSGIREYALYYSVDKDTIFQLYETGIPDTTLIFAGEPGHEYGFYTIATDNVGNVEPKKKHAEATTTPVGLDEQMTEVPKEFQLYPNYPNPFNPNTTIEYDLPKLCDVKLTIFNILGQRVRTLVDKKQPAGHYAILWDNKNESGMSVASGVYFYRIETQSYVKVRKMLLLR